MLQYLIKFSISLAVLYIFYRAVLRPLTFYQWNRFYLLGYSLLSLLIPFIDISTWISEEAVGDNRYINIIPSVSRYTLIAEKPHPSFYQQLTPANWVLLVFFAGALVMLARVLLQYISLRRLRGKSRLLTGVDHVQLYETSENITPFSFGNAIYINPARHTEEELQRIIQHEFVHVRQKHSIDLLTGELLCIINWFNPFAWFIRHAIRQNLEFIADRQVLQNGIAKKEYQYLLLKVIGAPQYALASHFNFSNLKKRIAMMNKMKSARLHLSKFFFVLPLLAVLLLSFRAYKSVNDKTVVLAGLLVDVNSLQPLENVKIYCKENNSSVFTDSKGYYTLEIPYENKPLHFTMELSKEGYSPFHQTENWGNFYEEGVRSKYRFSAELFGLSKTGDGFSRLVGSVPSREALNYEYVLSQMHLLKKEIEQNHSFTSFSYDTIPAPTPLANKKGFVLTIADNNGECVVLVKDQQRKIIKAVTLEEWNKNKKENEARYGAIPPPPPPPPAPPVPNVTDIYAAPEAPMKKNAESAPAIPAPVHVTPVAPAVPAAPVKNGDVVEIRPVAPLNADASQQIQPAAPMSGMATLQGINALYPPLYIVDGKEMPPGDPLSKINANKIERIDVLKGEKATGKYGNKAAYGAVEISTKKQEMPIPANVLVFIDGKEMPAGTKIEAVVKAAEIEVMHVYTGKEALDKYGDKGKNNVIEITTKKYRLEKGDNIKYKADSTVRVHFDQFIVNGTISTTGNESIIDGRFSFETKNDKPLLVFDDRELPQVISCSPNPGRYRLRTLTASEGVAKYGEKAKFGALEITTLRKGAEKK